MLGGYSLIPREGQPPPKYSVAFNLPRSVMGDDSKPPECRMDPSCVTLKVFLKDATNATGACPVVTVKEAPFEYE